MADSTIRHPFICCHLWQREMRILAAFEQRFQTRSRPIAALQRSRPEVGDRLEGRFSIRSSRFKAESVSDNLEMQTNKPLILLACD